MLDTTPPTGTILISGGAVLANNVWVALTLSSSDAVTMRFKNENGAWSAWEGYATSRAWTLSGGDGVKTVYVQYRDAAGNVSPSTIADIILDMTPPTGTININNGALYANTPRRVSRRVRRGCRAAVTASRPPMCSSVTLPATRQRA